MTGCLRFLPGIAMTGPPAPAGARILGVLEYAARVILKKDIIVTCAEGGGHVPTDPHNTREAYDIRVTDHTVEDLMRLNSTFQADLGSDAFYWQYEAPTADVPVVPGLPVVVNAAATAVHLHIQRKNNTVYPPAV